MLLDSSIADVRSGEREIERDRACSYLVPKAQVAAIRSRWSLIPLFDAKIRFQGPDPGSQVKSDHFNSLHSSFYVCCFGFNRTPGAQVEKGIV